MTKKIIVDNLTNSITRIDKFLVEVLKISRNKVNELYDQKLILLNHKPLKKLGMNLKINDEIEILDVENKHDFTKSIIKPYEVSLKVYYEDDYLWIVYKPSGMLSHPTNFQETNTLINAMKYNFQQYDKFYLVHRLDKDTAGLIIIAKHEHYQLKLQKMFEQNEIIKKYYAIVHHWFSDKHILIDVPICRSLQNKLYFQANEGKNCKDAQTEVFLVQNLEHNCALVDIILHTGRTHQIRVHLKYINHPIVNDPIYSNDKIKNEYFQYLMNYYLKFKHPFKNEIVEIKIDFDNEFKCELKRLGYQHEY